ncbi:MAG: hypothetical protein U5K76_08205 [Woeseiaceae bacterium]|nr:hypothetical protein [Woeseiaceae bacterium]
MSSPSPPISEVPTCPQQGQPARTGPDGRRIVRDTSAAPLLTRGIARWLLAQGTGPGGSRRDGRRSGGTGISSGPARAQLHRRRKPTRVRAAGVIPGDFFGAARRLLCRLHRAGIVHNDLAKEPDLLVTPAGCPAFIDFQLALHAPRRGRVFRLLAREDLRHLLKHKRTYCADRLTAREKAILASPSVPSRLRMASGKRVYMFVTRRLLGWADREGAADRRPRPKADRPDG